MLEPGGQEFGAFGVGVEHARVGPLGGKGAVEALDLAVGSGAVRLDEFSWMPRCPAAAVKSREGRWFLALSLMTRSTVMPSPMTVCT